MDTLVADADVRFAQPKLRPFRSLSVKCRLCLAQLRYVTPDETLKNPTPRKMHRKLSQLTVYRAITEIINNL